MANLIFSQPIELHPQYLAATPTVIGETNVDANWPTSNLFDYDPYEVFKTGSTTTTVLTIDFGSAREFQMISLLHCDISYNSQWQLEVSTNNSTWTTIFTAQPFWCNLSAIPGSWSTEDTDPRRGWLGYAHSFYLHSSLLTYRYIRITIDTSPASVMSFGRLFVGKIFQPAVNYSYGSDISVIDKSEKVDMPRSAPIFNRLGRSLQFNITLEFATQTEMENYLMELSYWAGTSREIFCCLDPTTVTNRHKKIIYGTLEEGIKIINQNYNIFEQKLSITSLY